MVKILIACTGSVATIKLTSLIQKLSSELHVEDVKIKIVLTKHARHFINESELSQLPHEVYRDEDEWLSWEKRGDPVLHIELSKWADVLLIAPLDANSLAKISNGICDNLLTCTVRAWDMSKPLMFCPAMNTKMYQHPLTGEQINKLVSWGYKHVPVTSKTLICGDTGLGAMAELDTIINNVKTIL